ncbi:hypothetical protein ACFQL1_14430 [Halomicroarcula sp. GCM10025709]|uniref:hypothetical protein n=1 Tax=Halomicroarcula sp. GCM10025709 TaxID=3252669 RepID=UPI003613654C
MADDRTGGRVRERDGIGAARRTSAAHHRRARDTPQSGLRAFAEEWGATFPALERALTGIERAAVAPADERNEILATTRRLLLEGTREEMAAFAASLRIPTTGLYAFGVLLPLALVSLVPAAGMAGIPVTRSLLVAAYVVVLPIGVLVAAAWILARRPVAFPPVVVSRSHPDVPDSPWMGILAGLVAGVGCQASERQSSLPGVSRWPQSASGPGRHSSGFSARSSECGSASSRSSPASPPRSRDSVDGSTAARPSNRRCRPSPTRARPRSRVC